LRAKGLYYHTLTIHVSQSPESLAKKGGYDLEVSLFGPPNFFGLSNITANVYYADSDLCDSNDLDSSMGYPIREMFDDDDNANAPFILMVDRGSCTFVQKVRNAQSIGAHAVVIADNTCLCDVGDLCTLENVECEQKPAILADDGSGGDIAIPSFLMLKQDADRIKQVLKENQNVVVAIDFIQPEKADRVEYELWMSPTDIVSREFILGFKETAEALRGHARFTPRVWIFDGIMSGCQGADGQNECFNLCINNGRYCATDPDDDLDSGLSGADVVIESLHWLCIWDLIGHGDERVGAQWWNYVSNFLDKCGDPDLFTNEECRKEAMADSDIDSELIAQCASEIGGPDEDKENKLLEEQIYLREQQGIISVPTFRVNKSLISGSLTPANALNAICAGFASGSAPRVCGASAEVQPTLPPASSSSSGSRPIPTPSTPASSLEGDETDIPNVEITEELIELQQPTQPPPGNATALNSTAPAPSTSPVMQTMAPTPEDDIDFTTSSGQYVSSCWALTLVAAVSFSQRSI